MRKVISILTLFVLVIVVVIAVQPLLTVRAIQQGLSEQDQQQLEYYIDFPLVREALKAQVSDALSAQAKEKLGNTPFAMLGLAFVSGLADKMVDSYITPQGLVSVLSGQVDAQTLKNKQSVKAKQQGAIDKGEADEGVPPSQEQQTPPKVFDEARYALINKALIEITLPTEKDKPAVKLELSRRGIQWRLTRIVLPLEQFVQP
jgi:uncharacterized protein YpmB